MLKIGAVKQFLLYGNILARFQENIVRLRISKHSWRLSKLLILKTKPSSTNHKLKIKSGNQLYPTKQRPFSNYH